MNRSLNLGRLDLAALGMVPKVLITFCLGAITALTMPPFDLWWVLGITFPALLRLIENSNPAKAFGFAWLFALGYFIAALHWIGFAFLVNAEADLWMMPFAVGGLSAFLALYWGVGAWFTKVLVNRGIDIFFAAPFCFSITEFLRGRLFSGFPWAVPGQAVDGMGGVSQAANLIGMNGLTLMLLLWAAMPLAFLRGHRAIAVSVLALLPAIWMLGEWRLAQNPTQFMANVNLRIVQPNFSQDDKWRGDNARKIFDDLLALSDAPSQNGRPITHIIWPESVVPFLIDESPEGLKEVGQMLGSQKILLAGAVRRSQPDNNADYFTSVLVIDGQARVLAHYDKSHLVPGGEYLPLAWALEPLGFRRVVSLPESFKAGSGAESMAIPGAGFVGAQICYEAIFPEQAVDPNNRPDWLVNVTNDGWFGNSTGPYQHLAQLRLRALEQGLGIARAANTGISAVIDPYGRYLIQSKIDVAGSFDQPLPAPLGPGLYSKFGDFMLALLLLTLAIVQLIIHKLRDFLT